MSDDISPERRAHLTSELTNLLSVHDQTWYQKCVSDLQGINQTLSDTDMQYSLPTDFLTQASANDWKEHLERSDALL